MRSEVVAVDGLDHANDAIRIRGAGQDGNPTGSGQADGGPAVPKLVTPKELRGAKENDGSVCCQPSSMRGCLSFQVEAEGLDVLGCDLGRRALRSKFAHPAAV